MIKLLAPALGTSLSPCYRLSYLPLPIIARISPFIAMFIFLLLSYISYLIILTFFNLLFVANDKVLNNSHIDMFSFILWEFRIISNKSIRYCNFVIIVSSKIIGHCNSRQSLCSKISLIIAILDHHCVLKCH